MYKGFSLEILQSSGNDDSFMDKLNIWEIGRAKTVAPSFINFALILSIPDALNKSRFSIIFNTTSLETLKKLKLFLSRLNFL